MSPSVAYHGLRDAAAQQVVILRVRAHPLNYRTFRVWQIQEHRQVALNTRFPQRGAYGKLVSIYVSIKSHK